MPTQYKYTAVDSFGKKSRGSIAADSTAAVEQELRQMELLPLAIKESRRRRSSLWPERFRTSHYENLTMFTNNLATLNRSGIPLLRALSMIDIGPKDGQFNQAIQGIRENVEHGRSLASAMAEYDYIFPAYYTASIEAGEQSGQLDIILDELAVFLERELDLLRMIKSAVRYPLMVILAITTAAAILIGTVIPRFANFYEAFDSELPWATRVLISVSNFMTDYWYLLLAGMVVGAISFARLLSYEKGRYWFDKTVLRLPVIGGVILKGNIARFCQMFRIMFKSGLPILQSLATLDEVIRNKAVGSDIRKIEKLFREGREADLTSEEFRYIPRLARQLMAVGLESGSLEKTLEEAGQHYTKAVMYMSRQLTALLEPFLTLFLGVLVLVLALAVFLPMWNLIHVFKP